MRWNGTTIYKYGASDPEAWGYHPNDLLFAEAIRSSCEGGDHTFDFGRSEVGNEGLRAFKAAWGADEESLVYSSVGGPPRSSRLDLPRMAEPIIKRAPVAFARVLGALFYRKAVRLPFGSPPLRAKADR
jgi:CelD/BcsL family acetyltransferase involved in cellulose biosynthesis